MIESHVNKQELSFRNKALRWQIGLAFFAFILIGINDGAIGVLLPSVQNFYSISKGTVGLLFLAATLGNLISSLSSGLLVEKFGIRLYLSGGTLVFTTGVFLISFGFSFPVMLGGQLFIGFGAAVIGAGLNSYLAMLPNNSALLNYLHGFYGIGALVGPLVASGFLTLHYGWNQVYYLWAALGLVVALGSFTLFRENQVLAKPIAAHEEVSGNVFAITLKLPVVWLGAIFLLIYGGIEVSVGSWSYTFLTENRKLDTLFSSWAVSGYWLGLTLGRLTLGKIVTRLGNQKLIQFCLAGVLVGVLLFWFLPLGLTSAIALAIIGYSLGPIFPTMIALLSSLVPIRLLPTSIGFMTSAGSMGAALFPWLAGSLAELFGLGVLLPYILLLSFGMIGLWLALQRRAAA